MGRRGRNILTSEATFFVTTSIINHAHIFTSDKYYNILMNNIKYYQKVYRFDIIGYIIMPSHFHWIVNVKPEAGTISDIMRDIKKYSAWDLMEALENDGRNDLLNLFIRAGKSEPGQKRKLWMKRFDDEVIRNRDMLRIKLEYIHNNPVKAGLVTLPEDYEYSSAKNYILGDHSLLYVKTDWN